MSTNTAEKVEPSTNASTETQLSVIAGHSKSFGNISIQLHSLGTAAYRLEWYSKMSGTSTSLSRLAANKYSVVKKWPLNRKLPVISADFEIRKAALVHFINNVDTLKTSTEIIYDAKKYCLELFAKFERLAPIVNPTFQKLRLQGAIGRAIEVRNSSGKEVIAEGTLLQLIGHHAEIRIEKRYNLQKQKNIQKFNTQRVFIK